MNRSTCTICFRASWSHFTVFKTLFLCEVCKSLAVKGGPLSDFITSVTPYVMNIFSILSTAHCAGVVATNSTTGILGYWSHNTIAMRFPNGPAKSMLTFLHGPSGSGVICRGSLQHTARCDSLAWYTFSNHFVYMSIYTREPDVCSQNLFRPSCSLMSFMGNLHCLISKWHRNNNYFSSQNHPVYTCKFCKYILVTFENHVIMIDLSLLCTLDNLLPDLILVGALCYFWSADGMLFFMIKLTYCWTHPVYPCSLCISVRVPGV